jgi:hypothetical protein
MKKIILFILFICSVSLEAQQDSPVPPGGMLEAHFVQYRHLNGFPKPIKSEGDMGLWEGKGLVWATRTPFPNAILITKSGLYQIEGKSKTAIVKAGGDSAMFDVMAGIFSMKEKGAVKGFFVEELPQSQNNWRIRLVPQNSQVQNFIKAITVEGDLHITHITISRPNGDRDEIAITDHVISESVSPQLRELFNE